MMQKDGLYADKGITPSTPMGKTRIYLHCKKLQFKEIYIEKHWNNVKNKGYT
jgi:hypothetical protein